MPKNAEEEALRQLKKLERMHPDTAETATLRNWLDIMTDLPWSNASKDNLDLQKGRADPRRRSLRPRTSERTNHRGPGRPKAERKAERARSCVSSALRESVRRRSDDRSRERLNRKFVRLSSGRPARRSRDPRPSPNLCRRDAGTNYSGDTTGGNKQSADHARRDRQGRRRFSRRPVVRFARSARSGAEFDAFATTISA